MASSDNNFSKMQEDAMRRVMEMQQRSRDAVKHNSENDETSAEKTDIAGLFGGIKIDEEKALIAMLIFILYKQGADIKLLMGLAYLLL
ncbi:hypothetical protein RASY3_10145 [Ruminococcus albus SY3]|uniref:Uncharacterized protein n=1 Tax=Ruminococcus albus SY3 TaxID=1341156 RepID=A0A011VXP6_RUMAL|nr:hypothetical protein [Ruminococcus albus]EXM40011.1 hypothetical protein RASY3_10145 [Ruminococcus albus SY3]